MRKVADVCRDLHVGEDWEADILRKDRRSVARKVAQHIYSATPLEAIPQRAWDVKEADDAELDDLLEPKEAGDD